MSDLHESVKQLLLANRRKKGSHQYTVPSPQSYPYQWLWDSCFHAIILTHFDLDAAKEEMRSLASSPLASGLIPHMLYWEESDVLNFDWGVDGTSAITQPPLLAYTVWRIFEKDNDKRFLEEMYPVMDRHYRHLLTRDPRGRHLVGLINPDESGEDNSPRFDLALGLPPRHSVKENNDKRFELFETNKECDFNASECMKNFFWVKDVPFSAYMIENLQCLANIAEELGDKDGALFCHEQARLMKEAMNTYMYHDGIYWSVCGPDYERVNVRTWAMFAPLICDSMSKVDAQNLVEQYLLDEKQFWSSYPIPTTAMNEDEYVPTESDEGPVWCHPNWRGPTWMAPNWFVYRGLKKYGFDKEASLLRSKSISLLEKSGFREYYHPSTGEGLGATDFTWGGLVIDMLD